MSTVLSIQLCSVTPQHETVLQEPVNFFTAEEWNNESEQQLLHQLNELLHILRPEAVRITVNICAEVKNVSKTDFLISKNINKVVEINTHKLTIREVEIIGLIMRGLTNQQIAEKLFISYETVKTHRKNILEKTGAKNTASLINYYHHTFFE